MELSKFQSLLITILIFLGHLKLIKNSLSMFNIHGTFSLLNQSIFSPIKIHKQIRFHKIRLLLLELTLKMISLRPHLLNLSRKLSSQVDTTRENLKMVNSKVKVNYSMRLELLKKETLLMENFMALIARVRTSTRRTRGK